ncbi:hypothetical protein BB561_006375 [Smittium simulii]|uniref:Uncharacterized protein n=1 Tax=Smittium simulii TaxID=133385 RepID=A0A2T9Y4W4_9FUNG|nr:hypothetical protein BB561_006375 [Smittium simulii]
MARISRFHRGGRGSIPRIGGGSVAQWTRRLTTNQEIPDGPILNTNGNMITSLNAKLNVWTKFFGNLADDTTGNNVTITLKATPNNKAPGIDTIPNTQKQSNNIRYGPMARIPRFHRGGRGSIPRIGGGSVAQWTRRLTTNQEIPDGPILNTNGKIVTHTGAKINVWTKFFGNLADNTTGNKVTIALKATPNNKAPGIDTIPSQIWKLMLQEKIKNNFNADVHKMQINNSKCGIISINQLTTDNFNIQNKIVSIVEKNTYLGIIFNNQWKFNETIKNNKN